ncbi:MAG TPA: hypothetical protein VLD59_20665 [Steroidobacteraceae bacterium]|nr:hypothetical protein [Steroidobacteraceae bacterium]
MKVLLAAVLLSLPVIGLAEDDEAKDIEKVNGSIEVEADQRVGDVSTVNGSIRIKDGATVEEAETVNGSVTLGERVVAESVETVNGTVKLGADTRVSEGVDTVNGAVTLARNVDVQQAVRTVNGDITLEAARVGGGIRTQEGDIEVGAGSRVAGGIKVEKNKGFSISLFKSTPKVVIGPGAVVEGPLEFEREVKLYVSETATIGEVKGATPVRFSGDEPND